MLGLAIVTSGLTPKLWSQTVSSLHWTYSGETGPDHWSSLDPSNAPCSVGRMESPIDLSKATSAKLARLVFDYHPSSWQILNNGHTVQVIVPKGSSLKANGRTYELVQFHFHHPSEEAIAGKHFDMVVHMVHKDAEGHLAVVAVLLADGKASPVLSTLWERLPREEGKLETLVTELNPMDLLPGEHGYYSFEGSLTTPPCSEGVQWFVMKSPLAISVQQERTFAALYPNNARPLQPRNGRPVMVSRR